MRGNQISLQPAYVLHQRAFRDSSAIVELFTPEHGRVGAVAKGVKRPKSPWRGLLQPFQPLLVSWLGGGDLKTLTAVEAQGSALHLPTLASGFYLNELLMRLVTRHDAQLALFGCYDHSLRALAEPQTTQPQDVTLRYFERDMLDALGYGLVLDRDAESGAPLEAAAVYRYVLERGPLPVREGAAEEGIPLHGRTLQALGGRVLADPAERHEAKRLMRAVLAGYLGPKPLHSRELFRRPSGA